MTNITIASYENKNEISSLEIYKLNFQNSKKVIPCVCFSNNINLKNELENNPAKGVIRGMAETQGGTIFVPSNLFNEFYEQTFKPISKRYKIKENPLVKINDLEKIFFKTFGTLAKIKEAKIIEFNPSYYL